MANTIKKEKTAEEQLSKALIPKEEQPYNIPDNWVWTNLGSTIELISGRDISTRLCNDAGIGIPYILGASNIENGVFTVERWIDNPEVISNEGDILLSVKGTIGKIYLQKEKEINISRQIMALRSLGMIDKFYLKYYLEHISEMLKESGNGLIPGITRSFIIKYILPLPPHPEQHRIIVSIERMFEQLDRAKELVQTAIDNFETRKSAILHKAFTGELTAKWRKENNTNMGSWCDKNLQSICLTKITDGTHQTPIYCDKDCGLPFISSKDIKLGKINWQNIKYIPQNLHDVLYKRIAPQRDDILLAKNGTTGVAAIVDTDIEFDIYVTLAVLRPNLNEIIPFYLLMVINSPICKTQFDENLTGIGVPNLHLRDIKEVTIPVPPISEQQEIVRILDDILKKEQNTNEFYSVIDKIDLMKKAILAKAYRGDLGTNDPSEESAITQLKESFESGNEI